MLSVDFETRSAIDLTATGVYRYAEDPSTDIWMMAWALGDGDVHLWLPGDPVPQVVADHVLAGGDMRAHNAQFERVIWREILGPRYGFPVPALEQWYCTAAEAAALALPRHLGQVAKVLKCDMQKDDDGRRLMLQMCKPRETLDDGTHVWWDEADKIARLAEYCMDDVRAERAVARRIRRLSAREREVYLLDQRMNDRGVKLDLPLVHAAQGIVARGLGEANERLEAVTGGALSAVTQTVATADWLREQGVEDVDGVASHMVREMLLRPDIPPVARAVLEIRQEAGGTSPTKLKAMLASVQADLRVRGMLLYHGASTGRWSGKGVQPQNFPRGEVKDVERFILSVLMDDYDGIEAAGERPLKVIAGMLRSMLIAADGHTFRAGDYSQIEARVLGWIADEPYGDREYERMAALIYGVPVEEIENPSERRTTGKNTVLGCGFQMGAKTYRRQAYEKDGTILPDGLPERAVQTYRANKPGIVQFWYDIERAATEAVRKPGSIVHVGHNGALRWTVRGQFLWCVLPSGRMLAYALPRIETRDTKRGPKTGMVFSGVNSYTRRWESRMAYGGLLTENVVQAMARDIMAEAMLRLEDAGYPVVLTVHDEIVCEVPDGQGSQDEFEAIMAQVPTWAPGLPVAVETWQGERYRK